jgi:hypothetical protein
MDRAEARDLSVRELTVRLGGQLSALVRQEPAFARAELFASARQAIAGGHCSQSRQSLAHRVAGLGRSGDRRYRERPAALGKRAHYRRCAHPGRRGLAALGRARLARSTPLLSMTPASVRKDISELTGRQGTG